MLFGGNIKMAMDSIRSSRWRSLLTMMGVIIGVFSVVTTVSLGEGVKQQIVGQINNFGPDLITIKPGRTVTRNSKGEINGINLLSTLGGRTLNEVDLQTIERTDTVGLAVPFSLITGTPQTEEASLSDAFVVASSDKTPDVLNQKVEFGEFFTADDADKEVAVIGKRVAEQLFKQNVPIGRSMTLRNTTFIVKGIFEEFENSPLTPGADYNSAIFIPYKVGKKISGGQVQIYQILAKPKAGITAPVAVNALESALRSNHDGQEDFTILTQRDNLATASSVLNLVTALIAGIAAVSLIVGGIGIMNIMLVSVSERTHEIGIRKAVGATNRQILGQFMIESAALSVCGALIAIVLSLIANYFIRVLTSLQPVITFPVMGVSVLAALLVGTIFGVMPAAKAASKDPIEALRRV